MAFVDIIPLVRAHLVDVVDVPVVVRVPDPRPDRFVQIRRVGGLAQPPVRDQARLDVWAWAPDDEPAMALALAVRTALWALPGRTLDGVPVYRIAEFLGPRLDEDPATSSPRVWATYDLSIRADSAIHLAPQEG